MHSEIFACSECGLLSTADTALKLPIVLNFGKKNEYPKRKEEGIESIGNAFTERSEGVVESDIAFYY